MAITGAHFLFYSTHPDADRAFMRDILHWPYVDDGGGWLIFKLPRAEAGVHPSGFPFVQTHADQKLLGAVVYLMCDDLDATVAELAAMNVTCTPIADAEWGRATTFPLPSGASLGLYQPTHKLALDL